MERQEWDIPTLEYYVRQLKETFPTTYGKIYVVGDHETGITRNATRFIKRSYVHSFTLEEAGRIRDKFIKKNPNLKVYHNFAWYEHRLKYLKSLDEK